MNLINKLKDGLTPEIFFQESSKKIPKAGKGGYGDVYASSIGQKNYALKRLTIDGDTNKALERVEQELSILERIQETPSKSSSMPVFHGYFIEKKNLFDDYYLVFDYYQKTLRDIIKDLQTQNQHLPFKFLETSMRQILHGMTFLQSIFVSHRDLKPENIMFDGENNLKIIDYGIAIDFSEFKDFRKSMGDSHEKTEKTQFTLNCEGTPNYMAPEIETEKYNPEKADVFSFGLIILELATLKKIKRKNANIFEKIDENLQKMREIYENELLKPEKKEFKKIMRILTECLRSEPAERPYFLDIFKELEAKEKIKYHIKVEEMTEDECRQIFEEGESKIKEAYDLLSSMLNENKKLKEENDKMREELCLKQKKIEELESVLSLKKESNEDLEIPNENVVSEQGNVFKKMKTQDSKILLRTFSVKNP